MTKQRMEAFLGNTQMRLVEAMARIDQNAKGILFLTDETGKLAGCVSDGDIRRFLIRTGDLTATAAQAMNPHPTTLTVRQTAEAARYMTQGITALPVVDAAGQVTDILLQCELQGSTPAVKGDLSNVPVVIMAGGKGTRLYPYTKILPKPLIPIGETPIVERIMNAFTEYGVDAFYLTVNYKKEMIKSYFGDGEFPFTVRYVEEEKPLGTGGSLTLIPERFTAPLFVTNCDALILADYSRIYEYHRTSGNAITMVAAVKNITVPYGVLHTKENGELIDMEEKPTLSHMVNTGMYVINPEAISHIPPDTLFHMTHLVEQMQREGYQVGVYPVSEDSFLDMGELDEMRRMEEKLHIVKD